MARELVIVRRERLRNLYTEEMDMYVVGGSARAGRPSLARSFVHPLRLPPRTRACAFLSIDRWERELAEKGLAIERPVV